MRDASFTSAALTICLLAASVLLAGCETTADKSAKLEKLNQGKFKQQKGVVVAEADPKVRAAKPVVLRDANGMAAVVRLTSKDKRAIERPPVQLVVSENGERLFQNDAPGLDPALTSVALLPAGATGYFVYDQLDVAGKQLKAQARVGAGKRLAAGLKLPKFEVSSVEYERDSDGNTLTGTIKNTSKVDQRKLVLYGIGRREGRIVAAGTAQIERLNAGKGAGFQMFFVGDPRGLDMKFFVPPTAVQ